MMDIKQLFLNETRSPITITDEPYWSYLLNKLEPYTGVKTNFNLFEKAMGTLGFSRSEDYRTFIKNLIRKSTEKLSKNKQFFKESPPPFGRKKTIFSKENVNKYFISIDIIQANFTVLHMGLEKSWKDFLDTINGDVLPEFITKNKLYRQQIIGLVYKGELQQIYNMILSSIQEQLLNAGIKKEDFVSFMSDELIVQVQNIDDYNFIEKSIKNYRDIVKIRLYIFEELGEGFVQHYIKSSVSQRDIEFRCINPTYLPQYISYYNNEDITDKDMHFMHDGLLAVFKRPLF